MNCLVSKLGQLALLTVTVTPLLLGSMLQNAQFLLYGVPSIQEHAL